MHKKTYNALICYKQIKTRQNISISSRKFIKKWQGEVIYKKTVKKYIFLKKEFFSQKKVQYNGVFHIWNS